MTNADVNTSKTYVVSEKEIQAFSLSLCRRLLNANSAEELQSFGISRGEFDAISQLPVAELVSLETTIREAISVTVDIGAIAERARKLSDRYELIRELLKYGASNKQLITWFSLSALELRRLRFNLNQYGKAGKPPALLEGRCRVLAKSLRRMWAAIESGEFREPATFLATSQETGVPIQMLAQVFGDMQLSDAFGKRKAS